MAGQLRVRGANNRDFVVIDKLYKESNFEFDTRHLERILVVEDDLGIVAVGILNTILEASFLTNQGRSRKNKVLALTALLAQVDVEVKAIGYSNFHLFVTNQPMLILLKKKFDFIKTNAIQTLVKWVK